jgi:hypothetical protein
MMNRDEGWGMDPRSRSNSRSSGTDANDVFNALIEASKDRPILKQALARLKALIEDHVTKNSLTERACLNILREIKESGVPNDVGNHFFKLTGQPFLQEENIALNIVRENIQENTRNEWAMRLHQKLIEELNKKDPKNDGLIRFLDTQKEQITNTVKTFFAKVKPDDNQRLYNDIASTLLENVLHANNINELKNTALIKKFAKRHPAIVIPPQIENDFLEANRDAALKAELQSNERQKKIKAFEGKGVSAPSAKENAETLAYRQKMMLTNEKDRINALSDWAASARFIASRVTDTAKLNKCSETAYTLKENLTILKAYNEAHLKRCNDLALSNDKKTLSKRPHYVREAKNTSDRIKDINKALQELKATMDGIAEALNMKGQLNEKTAYYSSIGDAAAIANSSAIATENYQAAHKTILDFFDKKPDTSQGHITGQSRLNTTDKLKVKEAKSIIDEIGGVKTGIIQTTFAGGGKDLHRQDFYIDPASIGLMSGRQGLVGSNRLPIDRIMQWAIKGVSNYQAYAHPPGETVTINAGTLPNECIEAIAIVCEARKMPYLITGRLIDADIKKMAEKAIKRYDVLAAQRGDVQHSDRLMSQKVEDTQLAPPPSVIKKR